MRIPPIQAAVIWEYLGDGEYRGTKKAKRRILLDAL
jgi:hypothetical protein